MRTWPPRTNLSVAGAIPAANSGAESTLMPDPARCMARELPLSDANNSPTGGTVCATPRAPSKRQTAQPQRTVLLRIAGKLVNRTRLLLAHKIVVVNCHGSDLF